LDGDDMAKDGEEDFELFVMGVMRDGEEDFELFATGMETEEP
jgi:hypothetical protein